MAASTKTKIRIRTLIAAFLILTPSALLGMAAATPGSANVGDITTAVTSPCEPGPVKPIAWTGPQGVPLNGLFWSQGWLQGAGPSENASVWLYNYEFDGSCVAGASAQVDAGPTYSCPASGTDSRPIEKQKITLPEGTYFDQNGGLWLQATSQNATVTGQNNDVGNRCAPTATGNTGTPYQDDRCLSCASYCMNCIPEDGTDLQLLP